MKDKHLLDSTDHYLSSHLKKYLATYAEQKLDDSTEDILESLHSRSFNHCLTIPVYNESHTFIESLLTKLDSAVWSNTLIILVVNQPDSDANTTQNQALWATLATLNFTSSVPTAPHNFFLTLNHLPSCSSIVALDYFTERRKLPKKKGVGLARKIGCALACHCIYQKVLRTAWLHTSDADTQLPDDYFNQTASNSLKELSAAVYAYTHIGENNAVTQATVLYERSLHYYVEGLRYAGSLYAHHTLGSCIAINTLAYVLVRGFTKRAGGEDFYCLNKLAKIGGIKQLTGDKLIIRARRSDRVPFGTGPAIEKILKNSDSLTTLTTYNPLIFWRLKKLLLSFEDLFCDKDTPEKWLGRQPSEIKTALESLQISGLLDHIRSQTKDSTSCARHIRHWFDAFKTLKFIHALEPHYPKVSLQEAESQLNAGFETQKITEAKS
jgi:hypothetical protein